MMVPGRVRVWPGPRWGSGHEDEKVIRHVTSPGPRCGGMVPAARREAAQLAPDPRCGGGCPYVVCQAAVGSFVAGWGV